MYFMSFYIDSRERTGGTNIFAGAATDTRFHVDRGYPRRILVFFVKGNHRDGTCRTVTGTVAAIHTIADGDTVLLDPNGMANLDARLLDVIKGLDSSCGTDIGTTCTLRTTEALLIAHGGKHEMHHI
jgi:hypothetical protein